tara:strand:+ start:90 stop:563 length:474 start_codon:yes stop_codon:yes gene_type:complete
MYRVGIGYDVHRLELENTLILGGVIIPYHKGTLAHSDGDVVIHAICDAILGAASLGDIGHFFPDNDEKYKDIDSKILLKEVFKMIEKLGYSIVNVDVSIILKEPKLKDYLNEMKFEISNCIKVSKENINIKATTSEKLGFVGRGEGVACHAITLLTK